MASKDVKKQAEIDLENAEKTVKITLMKDNGDYKEDVFASVNGRRYLIQRGKEVEVPTFIKAVIETSQNQDRQTADLIASEVARYENKK